jgi:hypothetical protein
MLSVGFVKGNERDSRAVQLGFSASRQVIATVSAYTRRLDEGYAKRDQVQHGPREVTAA